MIRKRGHLRYSIPVCLSVLLLAAYWGSDRPAPLTPLEAQLVGEWTDKGGTGSARIFRADRTLVTANDQFSGTWRIEEGRLMISYWQTFHVASNLASWYGIQSTYTSLCRSQDVDKCAWKIEFDDDEQSHALSHTVDQQHPDGKWYWNRESDQ